LIGLTAGMMVMMYCTMVTAEHVRQMPEKSATGVSVVEPQDLSYAEPALAAAVSAACMAARMTAVVTAATMAHATAAAMSATASAARKMHCSFVLYRLTIISKSLTKVSIA
jgi:hypothetical protein